jgi:DnaK suppressor protein
MVRLESEARELLLSLREAIVRGQNEPPPAGREASSQGGESTQDARRDLARRELAEIEAALRRIEDGNYGRCVSCGGPVGLQRLRAVPEARFCMACSGRHDLVRDEGDDRGV